MQRGDSICFHKDDPIRFVPAYRMFMIDPNSSTVYTILRYSWIFPVLIIIYYIVPLIISITFPGIIVYFRIVLYINQFDSYDKLQPSQPTLYLANFCPISSAYSGNSSRFTSVYDLTSYVSYDFSIMIEGSQWKWTYVFLPSYLDQILSTTRFNPVFNIVSLLLPSNSNCLLRFSSADVIHCYGVPIINLKVDCIPGTLIDQVIYCLRGQYRGNCFEFCGYFHSFIPIFIQVL